MIVELHKLETSNVVVSDKNKYMILSIEPYNNILSRRNCKLMSLTENYASENCVIFIHVMTDKSRIIFDNKLVEEILEIV